MEPAVRALAQRGAHRWYGALIATGTALLMSVLSLHCGSEKPTTSKQVTTKERESEAPQPCPKLVLRAIDERNLHAENHGKSLASLRLPKQSTCFGLAPGAVRVFQTDGLSDEKKITDCAKRCEFGITKD